MGRIDHLLKFACIAAALAVLCAAAAVFPSMPVEARPLGETAQMRLLPDGGPIRVTGDGRVLELRAPAAEQLPSYGFDAALMPVYDTGRQVDIAKLPVLPAGEAGPGTSYPEDGGAAPCVR